MNEARRETPEEAAAYFERARKMEILLRELTESESIFAYPSAIESTGPNLEAWLERVKRILDKAPRSYTSAARM